MKNNLKISSGTRLAISASLTVIGMLLKLIPQSQVNFVADILMLIAAGLTALPIAKTALIALRYKVIGIDLLVTIAVIGAIILGEYWEAAVVAVLFSLGHFLEARSINKTRNAIKLLLDQKPNLAYVERDGKIIELNPNKIKAGDVVVVKSGQQIPVDGKVIGGEAAVNQATITGESMPVDKAKADSVFAGTILTSGYLRVNTKTVGDDTMLGRILEMVEEAQDKKAKTQVFLERFASYYTPAIIVLAIITYLVSHDIYLALTLLVIACPGALVIATPISIVAGIGNGARNGLLIKGGESIENINSSRVIAFDKTGTLTEGQPRVTDVKAFGVTKSELLRLAATAEYYSEHPLGISIIAEYSRQNKSDLEAPEKTEVITGQGIQAIVDKAEILVGNRQLIVNSNIEVSTKVASCLQSSEQAGQTAMLVALDKKVVGIISVSDPVRNGAKSMIKQLQKAGKKIVMLTGDSKMTATAIAKQLGIKEVYSQLMPTDKVDYVTKLQQKYGTVTMVGDGVNDAPALATANASVATGGAGKDIAMEVADIVLLSGDVSKLTYALKLSYAVMNNIRMNIYFAVGVVILLLIGVLTKNVIMSLGMFIHVISVLVVIINASSLLKHR